MVLLRLMQIIERRDRLAEQRHVTVFIDELKFFLTRPVLDALSTVRDHQCNLLLGHQAPGDLLDVSKDISGQACQNTIVTNTNVKLIYKLNDEKDQRSAAGQTGEKTVMRQSMTQLTNMGVGEVANTDERQLMSVQEPLYSHNYFSQLKPRVGIIIGLGLAKLCFTSPIQVEKTQFLFPKFEVEPDYFAVLNSTEDVSNLNVTPIKPICEDEEKPTIQSELKHTEIVDSYDELHTMGHQESNNKNHFLEDVK